MKFINTFKAYFILSAIALMFSSNVNATTIPIAVSSNVFTPSNVSCNVGDTIKWNWVDGVHNTTSQSIPAGATAWAAPIDNSNLTFSYVISVAGTYNYDCTFHPGMAGTIVASSGGLGSGIYCEENFDFPVGDSIGMHGWTTFSGNGLNMIVATAPGMTYSGYPLSNIGNATMLNVTGADSYKPFTQADSTGSFYCSFMINVESAQLGEYFLAYLPNNSTTFYSGRVMARMNGSDLQFGITKGAATDTTQAGIWTTAPYALNTTYLMVLKFTFVEGGTNNDQVSLFVFSSGVPATEPTPTVGPLTFPSGDPGNIGRVALRQGVANRSPVLNIDGIRVAKTWNNILTSIGGSNQVSSVPENFRLEQNYPNPFNPSTTIKFSLPENGFASLSVYNTLGKEVANLVNNNLAAGTFSEKFDGSALTSGVYFYKLTFTGISGNSFTETKRLMLVK